MEDEIWKQERAGPDSLLARCLDKVVSAKASRLMAL